MRPRWQLFQGNASKAVEWKRAKIKMKIQKRIAKLEARLTEQVRPRKRGVPDWLQSEMEGYGWVFDAWADLVSAPDEMRGTSQTPLEDSAGTEASV